MTSSRSTKRCKRRSKSSKATPGQPVRTIYRQVRRERVVLDWRHLERATAGGAFQDMVLDLLESELGQDGFVPGPRHAGPDGGSDAWFDGKVGRHNAHWKIACAVRANVTALKRKVEDERKKALRDGATGMIVATPLDLTVAQVKALEACALKGKRRLKYVKVFARAKLEVLLRAHPWVAAEHFGRTLVPGFVPLGEPSQNDVPAQLDIDLQGRDAERQAFEEFLAADERVLLVLAPGGTGKSRFLRELPTLLRRPPSGKRAPAAGTRRSAWQRIPGPGALNEAILDGVPRGRPLLLALDDAGYELDEARALARYATIISGIDVRVVLAARTADAEVIERACQAAKADVRVLELAPISSTDKRAIVERDVPSLSKADQDALIQYSGDNLFVLRAGAAALRDGQHPERILKQTQLGDLIVRRMIVEAARHLGTDEQVAVRVLLRAAVDVPLPEREVDTDREFLALREGGLLRRVGHHVRFRADVEADLVLAHVARQAWGKAALRKMVSGANPNSLHQRIRNLAAAGAGLPAELVGEQCSAWAQAAARASLVERRRVLETLPRCARTAPDAVDDVCQRYMVIPPSDPSSELEKAFPQPALTADDFGPIVAALAHTGNESQALRLALALGESRVPAGRFENYRSSGLAQAIASPAHHDARSIRTTLDALPALLGSPRQAAAAAPICGAIVTLLLSPSFEWRTHNARALTMHAQSFSPTPTVKTIRAQARAVLTQMLRHEDREVRLAGAQAFRNMERGLSRVDTSAMKDLVAADAAAMLDVVAEGLPRETDLEIADMLEAEVVFLWASQRSCADGAGTLLCNISPSPRLKAYQLVHRPWQWQADYREVVPTAPSDERWSWWVHREFRGGPQPKEVAALLDRLRAECRDAGGLLELMAAIGPAPQWHRLLDPWCREDPALLRIALPESDAGWRRDLLRRVVRRFDMRETPNALLPALREMVVTAPIQQIYELLEDASPIRGEAYREISRLFAGAGRVEVRAILFSHVLSHPANTVADRIEDAFVALRDGDWSGAWDPVWSLLHPADVVVLLRSRPEIVRRLVDRIAEALSAAQDFLGRHSSWHLDQLLEIVSGAIEDGRVRLLERAVCDENVYQLGGLAADLAVDPVLLPGLVVMLVRLVSHGRLSSVDRVQTFLQQALEDKQLPLEALDLGRNLIAQADISARRVGIALLAEMRLSPDACVEICEMACEGADALWEEAKYASRTFDNTRGVYTSSIGEVPPAFLAIKDCLGEALQRTRTPGARVLVEELLSSIERDIQSHLRHEEEVLDPHS